MMHTWAGDACGCGCECGCERGPASSVRHGDQPSGFSLALTCVKKSANPLVMNVALIR